MTKTIVLSDVTKTYGDQTALAGINLTVEEGAFCVLLGPSGCGKSTLLRLISGLEPPGHGDIQLNGETVADPANGVWVQPGKRHLGMVFQSYALWPHKTARENIDWPLRIAGLRFDDRAKRVTEVADILNLGPYLDRYPSALSGGQQQRVAIARAIAPRPRLLLFDEPLSNLDAQLRVEMRAELLNLHQKTGATIVYVTHDQMEAMTMATQIVVLNDGRIEQDDDAQTVISRPQTAFVAKFVGNPPGNLITLGQTADRWAMADLSGLAGKLSADDHAFQAMVRPEKVRLHADAGPRRRAFRVIEQLPFGAEHLVRLDGDTGRMTALGPVLPCVRNGATVYAELPELPDAIFDDQGERIA